MNLLFDNELLVVNPKLATLIGLNEAIILQQMHYWIGKTSNEYDGKKWVYNSVTDWAKQFPFFSESTITRTIKNIEKKGLLFVGNYNKDGRDRTKWYSINYSKLDELEQIAFSQIDKMQDSKMTKCITSNCNNALDQNDQMHRVKMTKPLPETTTETTTDNILMSRNSGELQDDEKLKRFLEKYPEAHIHTPNGQKWGTEKDLECAKWIYDKIKAINQTIREPNWPDWANDIRLLRTQVIEGNFDNPHKEICRRFKLANTDPFWQSNIQSPAKLRKHWDKFFNFTSSTSGKPPSKAFTDTDYVAEAMQRMGAN